MNSEVNNCGALQIIHIFIHNWDNWYDWRVVQIKIISIKTSSFPPHLFLILYWSKQIFHLWCWRCFYFVKFSSICWFATRLNTKLNRRFSFNFSFGTILEKCNSSSCCCYINKFKDCNYISVWKQPWSHPL